LYGFSAQDDDCEDSQNRSEGHKQALNRTHDKAEHSFFSLLEVSTGDEGANGHSPSGNDHERTYHDENIAEPHWWWAAFATLHEFRLNHHHDSNSHMNEGKTGEERGKSSDHIVKDDKKPEMLFIFVVVGSVHVVDRRFSKLDTDGMFSPRHK
jgi:hypothetical protein